MKLLFEKKTAFFYVLSVIILITVVFIYYLNSKKAIASSDIMLHTQEIIGKNNEILFGTINLETGFRGFLLSGDKNFIASYSNAKTKIYIDIDKMMTLTRDNPMQQSNIIKLKKDLKDRITFTEKYIDLKRHSVLNNSNKIAIIEEGKSLTDKIRTTIC